MTDSEEEYVDWTDEELAAITIPTKADVNGDEFEFCPDHAPESYASVYAFPCPVAVEGDPPEKRTCIYFQKYLLRITSEGIHSHYFTMLFPASKYGPASEGYPGDENDKRIYHQEFRYGEPVGPPTLLSDNQLPDGTYVKQCLVCHDDCKRCSWNTHCVCPGKASGAVCVERYAPGEREALKLEDDKYDDEDD